MTLHLFSHRKGLKPSSKMAQVEAMDADLRVGLWNAVDASLRNAYFVFPGHFGTPVRSSSMAYLFEALWDEYFKRPVDALPNDINAAVQDLRKYFLSAAWNEVYDFLEFSAPFFSQLENGDIRAACNRVLERENAGYRFVGDEIVQITSEHEIAAIEGALSVTGRTAAVHEHLEAALRLLADRKAPDYRNSIKESISAVEALAQLITGERGATLGKALGRLDARVSLHGALRQALSSLYGYTSDAEGIRHALLDEPTLTSADARFMLVSCAAFTSYLIAKAAEAGIPI